MATKGYFIISDISGYTEFLTKSELDHAQEILQSLFDAQIENFKHPFVISGFRGDAIFAYAPEKSLVAAQSMLEALEIIYFVFADTLRQMQFNTPCTGRACQNMSPLDLKMCFHYGEYAIQKLGGREELLGANVILPHRMLKNNVTEQTGINCYALFSEAAAEALKLSELAVPLTPYAETYEHIGDVKMQVLDLHDVWYREQEKNRTITSLKDAWLLIELELPFPPPIAWEYITVPSLEKESTGYDSVNRTDSLGGRTQPETNLHGSYGAMNIYNRIVDGKPFEYYSLSQIAPDGIEYIQTRVFTPARDGTKISLRIKKPAGGGTDDFRVQPKELYMSVLDNLLPMINTAIEEGRITVA